MKRLAFCFILLVFTSGAESAAHAAWWPFGKDKFSYSIDIEVNDPALEDWFKELKLTKMRESFPPRDLGEVEQEGLALEMRLHEALRAKGYYEAQVTQIFDRQSNPPALHYQITPGPRAYVSEVRLEWENDALPSPDLQKLTVKPGDPIDAAAINADGDQLQSALGKEACLLSLSVKPVLQLNRTTHKAVLLYRVTHGPAANFGSVDITGNRRTKEKAIQRQLTWKRGKCFDAEKIADSQAALFDTQLFSAVKITPSAEVDAQGEVPIEIELTERAPRTIRAGANYATDQGFGVTLNWEHRNFSGGGEKLTADAVLAQQEQSLTLAERIPGFLRNDQTLALTSMLKHENTDAYKARSFSAMAGIERKFSKRFKGGAGVAYDLTRTSDVSAGTQSYSLASLPTFAEFDARDDRLDARKGYFLRASTTPYQDMLAGNIHFLKTQITGQAYFSAELPYKPTFALRGSLGSIVGAPYRRLPADLRFYAGGGGSVRGYSYQSLSPYLLGKPVGGGSLMELSGELRLRFSETIGGVAFLDAGNAYDSSLPTGKLYFGAGIGARYYTSFGPIRFDIGFPLNGGDIGQRGLALYVSLGQSF